MPHSVVLRIATLSLSLVLGLSTSAGAQPASGTITLSDTVAFDSNGRVEIDNQNGSVTVTTWNRAQVGYEVTLEPNEGDSVVVPESYVAHTGQVFSFGIADSWSIEIPGILKISPGASDETTGHYRIVMPNTAELVIDDHASTIEVSDVRADVSIDTHDGDVAVDGVEGFLEMETFSGTAEATGLSGGVDLETFSGRLTASFEEFPASSSVDTYSGPISLFLSADTGFELELDLDEEHLTVDEAFGPPSSDGGRRTYNGGGPELELESVSGPVELRPRESRETPSSP